MAETESDDALVTRVYISGLPPSMSKDQLRSHFAEKYPVTDAHVVADRRIGFVGFPSHELAKNAVKYFNKSFIRMSKISVTLARPVEVKRDASGQAAPVSQRFSRNQERKLLSGSAPSSKRKRGIHDEGERDGKISSLSIQEPRNEATQSKSMRTEEIQLEHPSTVETTEEHNSENVPKSDSDWLRGKTNRLLDLVEEGTPQIRPSLPQDDATGLVLEDASNDQKDDQTRDADNSNSPETTQTLSIPNARLFIRNLPFDTREEELRGAFSRHGRISEIHLVTDTKTSTGKGLGYVQFVEPKDAEQALLELDGRDFRGRLMHILPASDKKVQKLSEFELSKLPLKKQREIKRKGDASKSSFSWNSLYMNPDAVLASVADRLGVSKADLLDPASADAAVKQAHAETSVIKETKDYLTANGVNVDAFKNHARDDRTILLKNFAFGVTAEELSQMLSQYGTIEQLVFPTTGTIALVRYNEIHAVTLAMKQLAYRNFKGSVLYLEKAPQGLWAGGKSATTAEADVGPEERSDANPGTTVTVFVRNLNFSTTTARLVEAFKPLSGFLSARVKTRIDAQRPTELLSMGFGFVEFRAKGQAEAAIATMNGRLLDGHNLLVQFSQKATDLADERRSADASKNTNAKKTKIIIKNLPFEATKKDVRALFGAYGQLRTVRLPRKLDNTVRGFAFAEFVTAKEAVNALESLSSTHLLGRKLVLDFAEEETVDPESEIQAMEKKVQSHQATLTQHRMTGSARKKFNVDVREDVDAL